MSARAVIASIVRVRDGTARSDQDLVAVESPLTVRLHRRDTVSSRSLGVLMRTPGDDEELALGLLLAEGIIASRADVVGLRPGVLADDQASQPGDVLDVDLAPSVDLDAIGGRALASTSACGLCGRLEVRSVAVSGGSQWTGAPIVPDVISRLPLALRENQSVFDETGGLHAAGLFDANGNPLVIREDVGRHNAVDKVVGWALEAGRLPALHTVLAVSGRVAFEIVQKAASAGIPILAAVGAPSSLAVEAARAARITLIGFVRDGRFNVYTGRERVEV